MPGQRGFPLEREISVAEPLAALRSLARLPGPFLLHSSLADERGRWSFFGADPFALFRAERYERAVASFRAFAQRARTEERPAMSAPFTGGVVGYWAYDFGRRLEKLPSVAADDLGLPDFVLGFYDVVGAIDHASGRAFLYSSGLPLEGDARTQRARARLDRFSRWLESSERRPLREIGRSPGARARSTFSPDGYRRAVERVQEHIRRGDLFQANLSQRWTVDLPRGLVPRNPIARLLPGAREARHPVPFALALHESLARRSPAPFAGTLLAGDHAVVSASPERFLELKGRAVSTRPIKGTRPRGASPAEDRALSAELVASAKDRAENVMIVDVLRNDLGRVCEAGSVDTPALCELEEFPQVFHLTSTVTGRLKGGLDAFDLLHACFPGGSVTGAPKIRAMEVIDSIEPVRRHLYTGSLGYLDWRGDADWSIAIRTATVASGAIHFAAGGGITAGSDPDEEYRETLHKAEGLRLALEELLGPLALEPGVVHAG